MAKNIIGKTVRTSEGLRDVLFDELDSIRDGSSTASRAHAVCKLSTELIKTVQLEVEFYKNVTRGKDKESVPDTVLRLSRDTKALEPSRELKETRKMKGMKGKKKNQPQAA